VQCDTDPNDAVRAAHDNLAGGVEIEKRFAKLGLLTPTEGAEGCIAAIDRHLELPADAAVTTHGAAIRTAVNGKTVEDAQSALASQFVTVKDTDRTPRLRALYFDCFKALGSHDAALNAAGKELPETTAFGSWSFYAAKRRGDVSWVVPLLKGHAVAGRYYAAIAAVARADFFGIARGALDLDPDMKFGKRMSDAISDALLYSPLMADERTAIALRALCGFNTVRLWPFEQYDKAL
jgi:hypothetical protein